jgi:hypothetical protein
MQMNEGLQITTAALYFIGIIGGIIITKVFIIPWCDKRDAGKGGDKNE